MSFEKESPSPRAPDTYQKGLLKALGLTDPIINPPEKDVVVPEELILTPKKRMLPIGELPVPGTEIFRQVGKGLRGKKEA